MLNNLFSRNNALKTAAVADQLLSSWSEDGLIFHRAAIAHVKRELDAYLLQLDDEAYLSSLQDEALLGWEDLYRLLGDSDHKSSIALLGLPDVLDLKPQLVSDGALSDPDFRVSIRGWLQDGSRLINGGLDRTGARVRLDARDGLIPEASWRVLQAVRELSNKQREIPGERTNQLGWAGIRKLAKACGAGMDGFLAKSIVLNPDKLSLSLRKAPIDGVPVIEVLPGFDGQPERWLASFDAHTQVQDRYHIVEDDGSIVHVILPPEVRSVLEAVKRMPGRRVAGDAALQVLRNPFSVLGTDAIEVIDADEFEQNREAAGIRFHRFFVSPEFDDAGRIVQAELVLEELCKKPGEPARLRFAAAHEFAPFVCELEAKMAAGLACGFWHGYELEMADFHLEDLEGLQKLLERWKEEALGYLFNDIFDMSQYGDRVIALGPAQKTSSPFIGKEGGENWLPEALLKDSGLDAEILSKWDTANHEDFLEFCERIERARESGAERVRIPAIEVEVLFENALRILDAWAEKFETKAGSGNDEESVQKTALIVDGNIETAGATELRVPPMEDGAQPELPAALKENIQLREHQLHGVAWLQHLFRQTPNRVSGCLLADDMGLGKTLQLLSFIAWYLEQEGAQAAPVLIVAPVSLLDNWEREFDRFFHTGGMPVMKLYGLTLSAVKLKKGEIPASMQAQGIRNLLHPGWVGAAKIVLTTYETLRDQEISLARQRWGLVICDEAQKIKNPAALVTQAAKSLQAGFRVACTGTPVENSLTDLWCLFDFVQPGLLGALNEFGRTYRRPIECKTDEDNLALDRLRDLIEPQILRRTKDEVADLPPKLEDESCRQLTMSTLQDKLYRSEIARHNERSAFLEKAGDRNVAVLGLLHTLKLVCAHPQSLRPEGKLLDVSPKMRWLIDRLDLIRTAGEKVIVFTELRDIQRDLRLTIMDKFGLANVPIVNGDTSINASRGLNRQGIIDQFQSQPGFGVIILSTSAVGFGVNVQAANHVIHFTRPWNPAKEDQATDRAYRIGQTRKVWVYYPTVVSEHFETFERKLDALLARRRSVAHDMLNGSEDVDVMTLADTSEV